MCVRIITCVRVFYSTYTCILKPKCVCHYIVLHFSHNIHIKTNIHVHGRFSQTSFYCNCRFPRFCEMTPQGLCRIRVDYDSCADINNNDNCWPLLEPGYTSWVDARIDVYMFIWGGKPSLVSCGIVCGKAMSSLHGRDLKSGRGLPKQTFTFFILGNFFSNFSNVL